MGNWGFPEDPPNPINVPDTIDLYLSKYDEGRAKYHAAVAAYNAFQRLIQIRLQRGDALGRVVVAHLHALSHAAVAAPSGGQ